MKLLGFPVVETDMETPAIHIGRRHLTAREREVAQLAADGLTDKAIGLALGITENTVGVHITHIADALALNRSRNIRAQLARLFPAPG